MNNLKRYRILRRLTQKKLAEITGLSQSYVNELENGKKFNPSTSVVKKLALALETSVADLLDDRAEQEVIFKAQEKMELSNI